MKKGLGWLLATGGILAFMVLIFRVLLVPGAMLFTTDDNIGHLGLIQRALPQGFIGLWYDGLLVGEGRTVPLNLNFLLLHLLPLKPFANWYHGFELALASLFLSGFLHRRGLRAPAIAIAVLCACWLGTNFTLTYAGHINKFGVLLFATGFLLTLDLAVAQRSWAWGILAGGSAGMMVAEQQDVALFFALFLGPYALLRVIAAFRRCPRSYLAVLVPMVLVALLIVVRPVISGFETNVKNVTDVEQASPTEQWSFATQWSWPPEESIDFIAQGYTGWRSGEASGPYWGRMGRSDGWEKTGQGFMNFKLENVYLGLIPVVLAGCSLLWLRGPRRREVSMEVAFWAGAALLALLLAFGKYFPLYRILFELPILSSIRNPNKFLHIMQIAVAILAAYGSHAVFRLPFRAEHEVSDVE